MSQDKLDICPRCGSDACYVTEVNQDINNYFCYGCGFQSNTLMREGEEIMEEQMEIFLNSLIHAENYAIFGYNKTTLVELFLTLQVILVFIM